MVLLRSGRAFTGCHSSGRCRRFCPDANSKIQALLSYRMLTYCKAVKSTAKPVLAVRRIPQDGGKLPLQVGICCQRWDCHGIQQRRASLHSCLPACMARQTCCLHIRKQIVARALDNLPRMMESMGQTARGASRTHLCSQTSRDKHRHHCWADRSALICTLGVWRSGLKHCPPFRRQCMSCMSSTRSASGAACRTLNEYASSV